MSEQFKDTVEMLKDNANDALDTIAERERESTRGNEPATLHLDKKLKVTQIPCSSVAASTYINANEKENKENMGFSDNDTISDTLSDTISDSSHEAENTKYSQSSLFSQAIGQVNLEHREYFSSHDESEIPAVFAEYRQSSLDLMTRHIFTGNMTSKGPQYLPVYKHSELGKLLKLKQDRAGVWKYMELVKLSEDEADGGLKLWELPRAEAVFQRSVPKKVGGRKSHIGGLFAA